MVFDISDSPPTQRDLNAELARLENRRKSLLSQRNNFGTVAPVVLAGLAALAYSVFGTKCLLVASFLSLLAAGAGFVVSMSGSSKEPYIVFFPPLFFLGGAFITAFFGLRYVSVASMPALAYYLVLCLTNVCVELARVKDEMSDLEEVSSALDAPLQKVCKGNPAANSYIEAVGKQGRRLTQGESMAIFGNGVQ